MKTVTSQQTTKIPLHYLAHSFTGLYLWLGNADEQYDVKHMIQRHVQKKSSLAALNSWLTKMEKERKRRGLRILKRAIHLLEEISLEKTAH